MALHGSIEEEWDNPIEPWSPTGAPADDDEPVERKKVVVEVDGRRVEVSLPGDLAFGGSHAGGTVRRKAKGRSKGEFHGTHDDLLSVMQCGPPDG